MIANNIKLTGKIICRTGLHVGNVEGIHSPRGSDAPILQHPIQQTPYNAAPYISASSLRGKLRNIAEYLFSGNDLNKDFHSYTIEKDNREKEIKLYRHECRSIADMNKCEICSLFGIGGEGGHNLPGRLIFRDVKPLESEHTLEMKFENTLKRLVREANPRILERVRVETEFAFTILYRALNTDQPEQIVNHLSNLIACMRFLEDYYLGGNGSRGSGKIEFSEVDLNGFKYYTLKELQKNLSHIIQGREHDREK